MPTHLKSVAGIAGLLALGTLAGCGSASDVTAAAVSTATPAAASTATPTAPAAAAGAATGVAATDYSNIPGMAMGSPPQTSSMTCSDTGCDVIFIPPSADVIEPLGLVVRLVRSDTAHAVITMAGEQLTLSPGKPVHSHAVIVTLSGTPDKVVNINFRRAG